MTQALLLHLLRQHDGWTDRRRLDTAITVLMLGADAELISEGYRGIEEGRFRIDSKLVLDLHSRCPPQLRLALASSPAARCLPPAPFKRLFSKTIGQRPLPVQAQAQLASSLCTFLRLHHPDRGTDYAGFILDVLHSRRWQLHLPGLLLAGFLNDLTPADLELLHRRLIERTSKKHQSWLTAGYCMNALNGYCELLKRPRQVRRRVLAYCSSDEMVALYRKLHRQDPDEAIRLCAAYVLKAMRALRYPGHSRAPRG